MTRQLPDFDTHEFAHKSTDFAVAVFCINENGKLLEQLEKMQALEGCPDIIVADGGSTDGSTEHEKLKTRGVNTLLVKTGSGKLGAQMRMAFAYALDRGYKGLVVIDGNGKDGCEAIADFVRLLENGYDHVQGSRFIPGGISENLPFSRWLGVKLLHAPLMSVTSGFHHTDTTNGFRSYSRKLLEDPRLDIFRDVFEGYELHYYLARQAARLGFAVTETPVARRYPATGPLPSKISPIRGNANVLRKLFTVCAGRYD
ncbi:MAG: glycosyltransferase family 2 protein [Pseudomonadota bacterium]|nr:glycosyltransferase family 2 protein [Pseudomonadota bacterium]